MFIELTTPSGTKVIINTNDISTVIEDRCGVRIAWLTGPGPAVYKESYDSIRTLLNTKWIAE